MNMSQTGETTGEQRLDQWLNIACLFKTRSKATKACNERRVKVNGVVAKPATLVKSGDELTLKRPNGQFINIQILAISFRNVSSQEAKNLYNVEEQQLSEEAKELMELFAATVKYEKPKYKSQFGDDWKRCIEQAVIDAKVDLANAMQTKL